MRLPSGCLCCTNQPAGSNILELLRRIGEAGWPDPVLAGNIGPPPQGAHVILPGYQVGALLHQGRKRTVYRGTRDHDGAAVVLKTCTEEFPSPGAIASLRREFEILRGLDIPGVSRPAELVRYQDRLTLVLEVDGETTVKQLLRSGPLELGRFFDICLPLARTLAAVHRRGIIHKDINPSNLLFDSASGRVTLVDFGSASRFAAEPQPPTVPHLLEGTLAYLSPEQTGRMNRDVDYRSDFYSLGVSCYEMLTGRLPFETADALELIHCHIARAPVLPLALVPELPPALSALVLYRWLQDRIVRTCALEKISELEEVRTVLQEEVERYNNHQVHSTTGEIPRFRFEKARQAGNSLFRPFALPKPYDSLKDVFCLSGTRIVNGYRKISFINQEIEVPHVPLRETVDLHVIPDMERRSLEVRIWWQKNMVRALHLPMPTTPVHF